MKLLFEIWRKFLKEGPAATAMRLGIDIAHVKAIEETGLILNRYLGEGSYGKVYEVEDKETGQRMAAKVVPTTSTGFASETQNYNWIIKNRDKLPNDVKQHLVDVYELIETPDRQYLIILMEQLSPAGRDVIDQIFAHDTESKYSEEKEERILKDPEATYEIINNVLKANNMLRHMRGYRGLSNTDRTKAANNILGVFLSDQEVPESSIEQIYTMLTTYEISTPRWQRLFNVILNETEKLLLSPAAGVIKTMKKTLSQDEFTLPVDRSIMWTAAESIDSELQYNMSKQIIPVKYGAGYVDPQAGAGPEIAAVFPEIEGILNTIQFFAGKGWRARDLHAGNIMMRADTNQLVIVDVGLFVVERDFR
jgi:serine/threonine protein kinase